ncbi:MAG: YsnF/AvaK domain-containing protein, partial [Janthinobacterium lividum]
ITKGHAMVVVSPARSANREAIIHTLESTNPIDFDAKLEEWRQSGYDYQGSGSQGAGTASTTVNRAASTPANYAVNQTTVTDNIPASAGMASTAATMGASATSAMAGAASTSSASRGAMSTAAADTDMIKVMEERLRVGKREVAAGAVRVRSYVVERPVEEQVSLHEERVRVERHPVDRAVTATDAASAFQERTIEAQARSEEAVVQKDVRVVEEIGIKKEAADRTETVRDTVRKTEVDVEDTSAATRPAGAATTTEKSSSGSMGTGGPTTNPTAGATTSGTNAPRK